MKTISILRKPAATEQFAAPVATAGRYSNIKALRFPDRIAEARDRPEISTPVHLQLVISDYCNQACSFCSYRDPGYSSSQLFHIEGNYNPNRMIPEAKIIEILADAKALRVRAVQFTGGGEPTVHPGFQRAFDYAVELGLKVGLITNGVLLHRLDVSRAAWIRVSIDAGNAKTYAAIRSVREYQFDRALEAVARLRCGVGFVVTEQNWREVLDAVRLFKRVGASNVRIAPQFTASGSLPFYDDALALVREAKKEEAPGFSVVSRFEDKYAEIHSPPEDALCGYQYFTTYIGADLNLYRCCVMAYNARGLLGSLRDRALSDLWPEVVRGFREFDARGCAECHYQDINRTLAYVLDEKARVDEDFV